ncbi:MAG TPA: CBS domain-containing protein [Rubrivivax sp.]|nr:CBS domain-containing protein [Rubrivivax sp.]HPO17687.1 CBS domain-containing protein [Rubrivivax sp.]
MYQPLSAGGLCTRDTVVAERTLPLIEAARLMRELHVGSLVIVDDTAAGRVPAGLLTDRDIVTAVIARGVDPRLLRVEDVMSADPRTVLESDSALDALAVMRRAGVRRLVVTDARGVLQGVLALDDLVALAAEQLGAIAQALASGQSRERQRRP